MSDTLHFTLNGQAVQHDGPPTTRLLDLLRDRFGLSGAKPGCQIGRCGACMVHLDGQPANACLLMAWQLQGREVTTIEALAGHADSQPVQAALAECGAVQCGYCSAGLVMSLTALHRQSPRPDAASAAEQLVGHLCRCTGYGGLQRAVLRLFGTGPAGAPGQAAAPQHRTPAADASR